MDYSFEDTKAITKCNAIFCAEIAAVPTAVFAKGSDGKTHWLQQNSLVDITLSFKENYPNFHLKKLDSQNRYSGSEIAGYIQQINTNDCDMLVNSGSMANRSCKIHIMYHGESIQTASQTNFVDMYFGDNQNTLYEFSFPVRTRDLADIHGFKGNSLPLLDFTGQNDTAEMPILNIYPDEDNEQTGLGYDSANTSLSLTNYGNGSISNGQHASIFAAIGNPSAIQAGSYVAWDYLGNDMVTDCSSSRIENNRSCVFPFLNLIPFNAEAKTEQDKNTINSQPLNLLLQYALNKTDGSGVKIINKVTPLRLNIGTIIPKNYVINKQGSSLLTINLKRLYDKDTFEGFVYDFPLKEIKFSVKYNPAFQLAHKRVPGGYVYGIGDGYTELQKWLENFSFTEMQSGCFDLSAEPETMSNARTCMLQVETATNAWPVLDNRPIQLELYANYFSPLEHRQVNQFVGTISVQD